MIYIALILLANLGYLGIMIGNHHRKIVVRKAKSIQNFKKRGAVKEELSCNCGKPQCADKNITDEEIEIRFHEILDARIRTFGQSRHIMLFYFHISALSILTFLYLLWQIN